MSTWSRATYEMVADVLAMFAYPMAGSGCPAGLEGASPEEWASVHENQLAHQYDNMVVKFVQVFTADNANFSPVRFKDAIQTKGDRYFGAYEHLNVAPEYRNQAIGLGTILQQGEGSDESFFLFVSTLERLIREIVADHLPEDDKR